jgi:hypothetical protein
MPLWIMAALRMTLALLPEPIDDGFSYGRVTDFKDDFLGMAAAASCLWLSRLKPL